MLLNNGKSTITATLNEKKPGLYFPELDGLRFFAFLMVFVHHHNVLSGIPYISVIQYFGWIGVDLFFTLSAYLFTKLLVAEYETKGDISFKKFYLRRIFRIWPVYYVLLLFSILFYLLVQEKEITSEILLRIAGLATFTDNIIAAFRYYAPLPYIPHLWTISYEEQFYVFIPLIIYFLVKSSPKVKFIFAISTFLVLNLTRIIFIEANVSHPFIWVLPVTHFESIVLGIVIGFGGFDRLKIHSLVICLLSALFFVGVCLMPAIKETTYYLILSYSFVGLSTAFALLGVLRNQYLKDFLSRKVLVFLGKRSYGLYLFHLLGNGVATYAIKFIPFLPDQPVFHFTYSLSFTIIVSVISYRYIEKPFLVLKKKFEVVSSRPV